MNDYIQVDQMIDNWTKIGMSKAEIVIAVAQACLEWPYVFGAWGELCTPAKRKRRSRDDHPTIVSKCQVLNGKKSGCTGCKWLPGGVNVRMYDCRGFTDWVLNQVGIDLQGEGATSQWNSGSNWAEKGLIKDMPRDKVCCLFNYNSKNGKMEHTGLWLCNDMIIHCSSGVQYGKLKNFTHYAVPAGLYDGGETPVTERKPTLKRGSKGDAVRELQEILDRLGYDLGKCGIDSDFGRATEKAVKAFQQNAGIGVDGIVGAATWAALDLMKDQYAKPTDPEEKRYTVIITGRTAEQAYLLLEQYPGATMTQE